MIALVLPLLIGCAVGDLSLRPPVKGIDWNRYLGRWYEIARFDHRFERGLVGVTATYSLRPDGKIAVLNEGRAGSLAGKQKQARAVAKFTKVPGVLTVFFVPLFGGEYRVLVLDTKDYQYALVGSSSMNYLWILSRKPVIDDAIYARLVAQAAAMGYETDKLLKVVQE
jgi:lipocalin